MNTSDFNPQDIKNQPAEILNWRPISGFEDRYLVSDQGHVFSLLRNVRMSPSINNSGYYVIILSKNGMLRHATVHNLVATAFLGEVPTGCEINHKNGNKLDNRATNLEYITHAENKRHAMTLESHKRGSKVKNAKLTEENVLEIRKMLRSGKMSQEEIAEHFNITFQTVSDIKRRRRWSWLDPDDQNDFPRYTHRGGENR